MCLNSRTYNSIKMTFEELYDKISTGEISKTEAKKHFSLDWLETADKYILDVNRGMRTIIPEIIYGEYKNLKQCISISEGILSNKDLVVVSRSKYNAEIKAHFSSKYDILEGENIITIGTIPKSGPSILVVSAGAADHPITEECEIMLRSLGVEPLCYEDRGIAHPTRVIEAIKAGIEKEVKAIIVVAGMEGALAPFAASLVSLPVIGVPTSVGYGFRASEAALTSMLASCAPNLSVVNIDGGVRGAVVAALIAINSQK